MPKAKNPEAQTDSEQPRPDQAVPVATVKDRFGEAIKSHLSSNSGQMTIGEHEGEIVQMLSKWFHRPLSDLPQNPRAIAESYIPTWSDLSTAERQACAIVADGKLQATIGSRFEQARREQEGMPSDRFARRAMQNGFEKVKREMAGESDFESKVGEVNISNERCIELAQMPELEIAEWVELTGVGVGEKGPFRVTLGSVYFVRWEQEELEAWPPKEQAIMLRENKHEPLVFPCTPARLLDFIDSELSTIHGCFEAPDVFRLAVNSAAPTHRGGAN